MTEANESAPPIEEPLLDQLLREAVPEIKLALGNLIDRDNSRAIPDRYAKLLPETLLVVTLRPDAAEALQPVAAELERELTSSCMRHGSLYDRDYRVKLRGAADAGAPLYRVAKEHVRPGEAEPESPGTPAAGPAPAEATIAAPRLRTPAPVAPPVDPDATRVEGLPRPHPAAGWVPGRWELVVDDGEGGVAERFPLVAPQFTVGRQTENPELRSDVALSGAPSVSRRQLVVRWAPEAGAPGFLVCNLGLNALHVGDGEVPGANRKGTFRLEEVPEQHCRRVLPEEPMRVGEQGPVIRIRPAEAPDVPEDPDATRYG